MSLLQNAIKIIFYLISFFYYFFFLFQVQVVDFTEMSNANLDIFQVNSPLSSWNSLWIMQKSFLEVSESYSKFCNVIIAIWLKLQKENIPTSIPFHMFWLFKCEALLRLEISARTRARARARTNVHFTQILRPLGLNN